MTVGTRRALQRLVKATAAAADRFSPPSRGIVVLLYHRVGGGSGAELDLPFGLFERQVEIVAGRPVLALDDAVRLLRAPEEANVGPDPLVVTFDDGTADFVEVVLPLLVAHRLPATLYVATRFVEERRRFPDDGRPVSWQGLSDALSTGLVTVGSHTHSHALLDRLSPERAEQELRRSIGLIEERLQVPAEHFAYPKAVRPRGPVETLVRQTFVSAAIGGNRPNRAGLTDVHRLARSAIQRSDGMRWFEAKVNGGLAFEETIRRNVNRARYARADS
jgi:peptidoglycan/xylan/chitin deacetylase (PgdA/CDA1 family)